MIQAFAMMDHVRHHEKPRSRCVQQSFRNNVDGMIHGSIPISTNRSRCALKFMYHGIRTVMSIVNRRFIASDPVKA